jgi:hypothetical protein
MKMKSSAIALAALCCAAAFGAQARAADVSAVEAGLNAALNTQKVYVTAPGFPSKMHDLALCLEDPEAKENASKQYHPAARQGWKRMIAFGRALEKGGWVRLKQGTFFDRDLYNRPFKFTGYLMSVEPKLKDYVAVVPYDGRVLLRAGVSAVDKVVSVRDEGGGKVTATFTTKLGSPSPWLDGGTEKYASPRALLGGRESVAMECGKDKCSVSDQAFLDGLKKPLTDSQR